MLVQRVHEIEKHSQTAHNDLWLFLYAKHCKPRLQVFSRNRTNTENLLAEYNFMVVTQHANAHNKGIITVPRWASPRESLTLMTVQRENPLGKTGKQDWRRSQDQHRTEKKKKKKTRDERVDTIAELWHKLWGKWGLPDEKLNTWTGTATDTHRQDRGSGPAFRMNSVTLLSHYSTPSPSPLLSFNTQRTAGLSLQRCKPIFHPLSPPPPPPAPTPLNYPPSLSILGMAVEILAQTFRRLPGCQTEQKGSFKRRANSPDTHTYQILTSLTRFTRECERCVLTKNSTAFFSSQKENLQARRAQLGDTGKNKNEINTIIGTVYEVEKRNLDVTVIHTVEQMFWID